MSIHASDCDLCAGEGGDVVRRTGKLRVVLVDDANYPGFCRVVWNAHVREMTDLSEEDRELVMRTVWAVESAVRDTMQPHKVNVASLGNMTPHVHWHVIPRFTDDAHFPSPVWAAAQRDPDASSLAARRGLIPRLRAELERRLGHLSDS